jgi:outer membrane biosynthesis protein TonB
MKLFSGKRIGQSGGELATAALFSFMLHAIFLAAALFYLQTNLKKYSPPFYEVKLVGQPAESSELPKAPPVAGQPAPPKQKAMAALKKAAPHAKKAAPKTLKATAKKGAMPELAKPLKKPVPEEPAGSGQPPAAARETPPAGTTGRGVKGESVAVTTPQQDFKFGWYLAAVRDKIGQNWRPPPDTKDAKARVTFSINRSGWVGEANLDAEHSNGTFGFKQAAIRAIRASNPFPPLPEEFSKQTLEFSVDLMAE